jgi:gliding motility-associated-like protein
MRIFTALFFFLLLGIGTQAQIANDDFKNAQELKIDEKGYAFDTIITKTFLLSNASTESGEFFDSIPKTASITASSVWYTFSIPTARNVRIDLKHKGFRVPPHYAGLTVYNASSGIPQKDNLNRVFPSIPKFGASINSCAKPGTYYIQVLGHKNLTDSVYLEFSVGKSPQAEFDEPTEAHDFGLLSRVVEKEFEVGCLSLDYEDFYCSKDSIYTQSNWFTFTTDSFPEFINYKLLDAVTKKGIRASLISLYKGNCINDVANLEPVIECTDSLDLSCGLEPLTTYTLYLKWPYDFNARVKMKMKKRGFGFTRTADPKNLYDSVKLGTIDSNLSVHYIDYLSCDSRIDKYACTTEMMSFGGETLHSLVTFELKDSMILKLRPDVFLDTPFVSDNAIDLKEYSWGALLFKGDITDTCQLEFDRILTFNNCLPAGKYTLQLRFGEKYKWYNVLGSVLRANLHFRELVTQKKAIHKRPQIAEIMDTLYVNDTSFGGTIPTISDSDYFASADTFFVIDSTAVHGRFLFRTFYVTDTVNVKISTAGSFKIKNLIFRGKAQNRNLKYLDSIYGAPNPFTVRKAFETKCVPLDTGWYTVVSVLPFECGIKDRVHYNTIMVEEVEIPKSNFNFASRAHEVENLNPIGPSKTNSGTADNPNYTATYQLPTGFYDCEMDIPRHLPNDCGISNFNQAYYVFKVSETSYLRIDNLAEVKSRMYLFPHDIRTDSAKFKDITNSYSPCYGSEGYNAFCKVKPGIYTLVFNGKRREWVTPVLTFDKYVDDYDFASTAFDMGAVKPGENSSKTITIGCGTSINNTDYPIDKRSEISTSGFEYPIKPGSVKTFREKSNIWMTFTIEDPGVVQVSGEILNFVQRLEFKNLFPTVVYEAPDGQEIDFRKLVSTGKIDTTEEMGLRPVAWKYNEEKEVLEFNKGKCTKTRYYVLLTFAYPHLYPYTFQAQFPNINFKLDVEFTPVNHRGNESDFCKNALEIKLYDNDTSSQRINLTCHTSGEGYGEDGSNMGCLGNKDDVKTSWVKVNFLGNSKNDITFTLNENTTAVPQDMKYRVFTGSCAALTPGPCVAEVVGGYKLECLEKQEYYIQLSAPLDALGTFKVSTESEISKNSFCKPIMPGPVDANFESKQSCSALDSFEFANLSTQGDSVDYKWYFNGSDVSTSKSPKYFFDPANNGQDSFLVKLVVTNTGKDVSDSIEKFVYKVREFEFDAGTDLTVDCGKVLETKPLSTLRPQQIVWSPSNLVADPFALNTEITPNGLEEFTLVVTAQYEACTITDSIKVTGAPKADSTFKMSLCEGESLRIKPEVNAAFFKWADGETNKNRTVTNEGSYEFLFGKGPECASTYTYQVVAHKKPNYSVEDSIMCIGQSIEFKPVGLSDFDVIWSNGDTSYSKIVLLPGAYSAKIIGDNGCTTYYSKTIEDTSFFSPSMVDAFVCERNIELDAKVENAQYIWDDGSTSKTRTVNQNGLYKVQISIGDCLFADEAKIEFSKLDNFSISDTSLCDSTSVVIELPKKYRFYDVQNLEIPNPMAIESPGTYMLFTKDSHCVKGDTFTFTSIKTPVSALGPDTQLCFPMAYKLGVIGAQNATWNSGNDSLQIVAIDTGLYIVEARNENCLMQDSIYIDLDKDCFVDLFVPNAFSPGPNDDINTHFKPKAANITDYKMRIYNRWGQLLYVTDDLDKGWDGSFNNQICPTEMYMYVIYYKPYKMAPKTTSGQFMLLR